MVEGLGGSTLLDVSSAIRRRACPSSGCGKRSGRGYRCDPADQNATADRAHPHSRRVQALRSRSSNENAPPLVISTFETTQGQRPTRLIGEIHVVPSALHAGERQAFGRIVPTLIAAPLIRSTRHRTRLTSVRSRRGAAYAGGLWRYSSSRSGEAGWRAGRGLAPSDLFT